MNRSFFLAAAGLACLLLLVPAPARAGLGERVREREAKVLLEKADRLYNLREHAPAVQLYQNIITLYAKTQVVYAAHLQLGRHFRAEQQFSEAAGHFRKCADGAEDDNLVAEAMLLVGACYNDQKQYGKSFTILRDVTERFPGTEFCNRAFQLIGDGHLALKNYKRAIEAYHMVGTAVPKNDPNLRKLTPGKRLFIRVQDPDLRMLARLRQSIQAEVASSSGDRETISLTPLGAGGNEFMGWIGTELGKPVPGNGTLQVLGTDTVEVRYTDKHTSEGKPDVKRLHIITMAGDGRLVFTDGVYRHKVHGVAVERTANIRVVDPDRSAGAEQNEIKVLVQVHREIPLTEEEKAAAIAGGKEPTPKFETVDRLEMTLKEQGSPDEGFHTGVFVGHAQVREGRPDPKDDVLQVRSGDLIEAHYTDEVRLTAEKPVTVSDKVKVVRGALNPMKAFDSNIANHRLRVRTELQVAATLLEMGRIYKDLGLKEQAYHKLDEALYEAGKVARIQGGQDRKLLEECQYLLWRIYFERDEPHRARAVCMTLLRQFPDSHYVDDALYTIARAAQAAEKYGSAIATYRQLLRVKDSPLRADAQFNIALCYEKMGEKHRSFQEAALREYRKCAELFPESKFAPDAIIKIADFYYRTRDYARAVEIYERTLRDYRDAGFADQILFNFGRSLMEIGDTARAAQQFSRLIADYPESKYVAVAKVLVEKLRAAPAAGGGGFGEGG